MLTTLLYVHNYLDLQVFYSEFSVQRMGRARGISLGNILYFAGTALAMSVILPGRIARWAAWVAG